MKSSSHSFRQILLSVALALLAVPIEAQAAKHELWHGLVSFSRPGKSVVTESAAQGFDEAYLVSPRNQKSRPVAAIVVREMLDPDLSALSLDALAQRLEDWLSEGGFTADRVSVNARKRQISGSLSGAANVPWSKRRVRCAGTFRLIRVSQGTVVGVIAFAATKDFGKPFARPFRQVVATFKTAKTQ